MNQWLIRLKKLLILYLRIAWSLTLSLISLFALPSFCLGQLNLPDASSGSIKPANEMALFSEIPSVYSASKFDQKVTEAPASISIVTASDIKMYGYRSLSDIIQSVPGFFTTYDRNYAYIGVRGFGRPGDYNSRVLLLVDGARLNDSVYNTAPIGTDFPVDVDLIERVEFIRGPGSSLYGANAFFAVINVITKRGRDLKGIELASEAGSFDTYKGRASYGNKFQNGLEMLVSGSYYTSGGQNLFFREYNSPATNYGIARNCDGDHSYNFFSKLSYYDFSMEGGYQSREKGIPTGVFDTVFNDPRTLTVDEKAFWDLEYDHKFENQLGVMARLLYGHYRYTGDYLYNAALPGYPIDPVLNKDLGVSESMGGEFQITKTLFDQHKLIIGADYYDNFVEAQKTYDEVPFKMYLNDKRSSTDWGVYLQDEYHIIRNLILNAGVRYDEYSTFGGTINPRSALIYNPFEKTTFKLIYGSAFRPPNDYELYYNDGTSIKNNLNLKPETITTYELLWEQYIGKYLRTSTSVYYNEIEDLINYRTDPIDGLSEPFNSKGANAKGIELELEGKFPRDVQGRISYDLQRAEDTATGKTLTNSPEHQVKLNVRVPLIPEQLFLGTEFIFMSSRKTLAGNETDNAFVTNLTLFAPNVTKRLKISASVYNLFNQKFGEPAGIDFKQDIIQQDGIAFRLQCIYSF